MMVWRYIIQSNGATIVTQNTDYAEKRSKLGNVVFCKRENNINKFKN